MNWIINEPIDRIGESWEYEIQKITIHAQNSLGTLIGSDRISELNEEICRGPCHHSPYPPRSFLGCTQIFPLPAILNSGLNSWAQLYQHGSNSSMNWKIPFGCEEGRPGGCSAKTGKEWDGLHCGDIHQGNQHRSHQSEKLRTSGCGTTLM